MNLDEMLTIESRKSEQEKTDKIQDFVNKQLNGMKLSGNTETPEQKIQREFEIEAAGSKMEEKKIDPPKADVNFEFDFNQPQKQE